MTIEDELQEVIENEMIAAGKRLANDIEAMCATSAFDPEQRGVLVEHFDAMSHRVSLSADVQWGHVVFLHVGGTK